MKIEVAVTINAPAEKVWEYYTQPAHITKWNNASEDWHTPSSENDLTIGGKFVYRMEAKDGSSGFDFSGVYDEIVDYRTIKYTIDDGRKVDVNMEAVEKGTKVTITFDAENEYPPEFQKQGWQSILDNFKKYVEVN